MEPITIPPTIEGIEQALELILSEEERAPILNALELRKRNQRIRSRYAALREQHGSKRARQILSESENLSSKAIESIIYPINLS